MKKSILAAAVSALFMVGAAHAEVNPNDTSATLSVTGSVTQEYSCAVNLSQSTITLNSDINDLVTQGTSTANGSTVVISLTGSDECVNLANNGKIAYKMSGKADNADGNVLANTSTENAATGVGIGLYDYQGNVVPVNGEPLLARKSDSTPLSLSLVKLNGQEAVAGSVQGSLTIEVERL